MSGKITNSRILYYYNFLLSSIKKKFVSDSLWLMLAQVVLAVSGILINIIIGNYYGAIGLGVFNQALSIYIIASSFAALGLNNATLKFTAEHDFTDEKGTYLLSTNLAIISTLSVIIAVGICLFSVYSSTFFSSDIVAKSVAINMIALPLFSINKNLMAFHNGRREIKLFSIIRGLRWTLTILFISIAIIFKMLIEYTLFSFLFAEIILFVILIFKNKKFIKFRFSMTVLKKNINFGVKSFLSEVIATSNGKIEIIILGYMLSSYDVGIYSFASTIARGLFIIPTVFSQNFNPIISKLYSQKNFVDIVKYVKKIRLTTFFIMLPSIAIVTLLYYLIIVNIMDVNYKASIPVFLILLVGVFSFSLVSWAGSILIMGGHLNANIYRVFIVLLINIVSIILFIKLYGVIGAAIGTSVAFILTTVIHVMFVKKCMNINLITR